MVNEQKQPRPKTNVEKVTNFMEFGSPLNQAFVLEALRRYTLEVKANEAVLKADKTSFISGTAWVACAYDWEKIAGKDV